MKSATDRFQFGLITGALLFASFGSAALAEDTWPGMTPSSVVATEPGIGDQTSEYVRDYLSDPRRAGSLAGSILGGALVAHPAGPLVGSLIGFFVGKRTLFNEEKARAEKASVLYARRDIVPQDGPAQTIPTISFASSQGITFDQPDAAKAGQVPVANLPNSSFSPAQISAMCGGQALVDPRLRALCFYSHGS